jgi:amino acid permease
MLKAQAMRGYIPQLGPFQTFFTLMKGFVGIAMLLFPNGYYNAGWLFGTISIIVISGLVIFSSNLLITVSERFPGSFSSLGEKSMGRIGKIICDISLGLTQTGFV